jgi:hypothetical protein
MPVAYKLINPKNLLMLHIHFHHDLGKVISPSVEAQGHDGAR